jgi:P-type Cu+ transporter
MSIFLAHPADRFNNVKEDNVKETVTTTKACYHCGDECGVEMISIEEKPFCCQGCKMVFEIIHANGLGQYYKLEKQPGISTKGAKKEQYAWLEDKDITRQLIDFQNDEYTKISFYLPQIHCASCIWLLENLYKLNEEVLATNVNFLKRQAHITFNHHKLSLRQLVELLAIIGYTPQINLNDLDNEAKKQPVDKSLYYQLGIAGFAFGNIMLLSFPEYLGLENVLFKQWFNYLNLLLSIPVVFYSSIHYLKSAWFGLKQGNFNIDLPIGLGILTLFGRSIFEVVVLGEAGYWDSLAGLIFFLLIGRWFQQKTYNQLSFERDYKSYFPIAATVLQKEKTISTTLQQLNVGDRILIKNQELIPTDGILTKGIAEIDYSFVTGEANPISKKIGDSLFAGGRQIGQSIEVTITKKVNQSYLTQLWNEDAFKKNETANTSIIANTIGKYFTYVMLMIAFSTLFYWWSMDTFIAWQSFTAVLIIACPCAAVLAVPFILGNVLRILAKDGFYVKNTLVLEKLNKMDAVVLDKTGTITDNDKTDLQYNGQQLTDYEQYLVYKMASHSNHPLSLAVAKKFELRKNDFNVENKSFQETVSQGIATHFDGYFIKLGSAKFVNVPSECLKEGSVYLEINNEFKGGFKIIPSYRSQLKQVLDYFKKFSTLFLLSGDNDNERENLSSLFQKNHLFFQKSPKDKLDFIENLQKQKHKVLMFGDGLNDAGALKQSDVGIVLTENTNNFTPASDAILEANHFSRLPNYLRLIKTSIYLVYIAYGFAFFYNIIGLSFAVQGLLSPVIAAILMPLSSISIVIFGVVSTLLAGKYYLPQQLSDKS